MAIFIAAFLTYYDLRKRSNAPEQNPLLIEAKRKHFEDLCKVIQVWKDNLVFTVNNPLDKYQVIFPTSFSKEDSEPSSIFQKGARWYIGQNSEVTLWFPVEDDELFPCLRLHLQRPQLWDSFEELKNRLTEGIKRTSLSQEDQRIYVDKTESLTYKIVHELDIALANRILPGKCEACPDYHEVRGESNANRQ